MASDKTYFENGTWAPPFEEVDTKAAGMPADVATSSGCVRVFVAGAVTHVGKTSVCLGLLAALRNAGLKASELGYIKPATQCEAPDLLSKWCAAEGVEYVAGENAPLVFFSGFTRSFLAGEQGTSAQWLQKIQDKIASMSEGRRVLIIDGVGFPSVGSIVGVDNADVAKAAKAPVLLVCKSGVGSAIDSFSLNSSYFLAKGVPVLGALFNLGETEGFYSWEKCQESIGAWFTQQSRRERFYGVVPKVAQLDGLREKISETDEEALENMAKMNAEHFGKHVDIDGIFADAAADPWCRTGAAPRLGTGLAALPKGGPKVAASGSAPATKSFQPLSREQVTSAAKKEGAKRWWLRIRGSILGIQANHWRLHLASRHIMTYPLIRQLRFKIIGDDFPHIIRSPCSRLDKFRDIQHVVVYTVVRLGTFKMGPGADGNGTHKANVAGLLDE